ncbi:hypothetical protein FRB94_000762 [Tulasnella sp. JGI-2019a]|nr:hypothetical protein FRB93_002685 [Tulasnella sp. JGI-2019a]KAG9013782.1 hypothetical protein FRB94_000762 [Tulasnella sp. JGI-2019a]KAG9038809.1 hypothetical protein FRB95_014358 [Tulasnella sp. JGI-2019a]
MSTAGYQRLATRSPSPPLGDSSPGMQPLTVETPTYDRFNPRPPHWTHRALLIAFVIFIHVLAYKLMPVGTQPMEYTDHTHDYLYEAVEQ